MKHRKKDRENGQTERDRQRTKEEIFTYASEIGREERQREKTTDRETERETTDRETERETTDRETERENDR